MKTYDPLISPDPDVWVALDEAEQLRMVLEFHETLEEELSEGGEIAHAGIHVVVENQIATNIDPVPTTVSKLIRQGLDRHEAIHAIGAIICEDLYKLLKNKDSSWDIKKYRKRLEKLTAKRWRKGQW